MAHLTSGVLAGFELARLRAAVGWAADDVSWGDVPAWISAVTTGIALIFAAVAAMAARRVYHIESERDRANAAAQAKQEERERRAQAALISAWWGSDLAGSTADSFGTFVRNASEAPVYQGNVYVVDANDADAGEQFVLPVIPPGSAATFHPSRGGRSTAESQGEYRVELSFTDSAGVRWLRDQRGQLSELRPTLVIWADAQRAKALERFASEFLATHQVRVKFRTGRLETLHEDFVALRDKDLLPDIFVGSHDRIGDLVRHGLIQPVALSARRTEMFSSIAIDAMTLDGNLYGVPYGVDTICLVRNLELAPHEPVTFEHMLAHGQALQADGRVSQAVTLQVGTTGEAYFMYPLFVSAGGAMFGRDRDGAWNHRDVRFASPGSVAAFQRLSGLGEQGSGILRRDIDRDVASQLFADRQTPYIICTSRALGLARRADIPVAVSPVPRFAGGAPARSLTMVQGFFLCSGGANRTVAEDLICDYMTRTDVALALHHVQPRPPALRNALRMVINEDPLVAEWHRLCAEGEPMPSFSYNSDVWRAFNAAEVSIVGGAAVEPVARELAARVRRLVGGSAARPPGGGAA